MRKPQLLIVIFFLCLTVLSALPAKGMMDQKEETGAYQVIPDEAIRLRILANSDEEDDQNLKREIRDRVNADITEWVADIADIEEARQEIRNRLPEIKQTVQEVLTEKGVDQTYTVDYDRDVSFPTKVYGSYVYPAGNYEAILITLGEGKGANWWCVLFPPLCFLDFSNGTTVTDQAEAEQQKTEQVAEKEEEKLEVKFFFLRWFT